MLGRRNLKRKNIEEILVDVNNFAFSNSEDEEDEELDGDSEYSDELSEDTEDGLSENEADPNSDERLCDDNDDSLYFSDNSDRVDFTELSEMWSSDVKPIPQFTFASDAKGVIEADISVTSTPRDVFDTLFTGDIVEMLVKSTNEYGRDLYSKPVPPTRKSPKVIFHDTSATEMHKFFGLSLLMAQAKFPSIRNAFSKHPLYFHPVFPASMSGRRYYY